MDHLTIKEFDKKLNQGEKMITYLNKDVNYTVMDGSEEHAIMRHVRKLAEIGRLTMAQKRTNNMSVIGNFDFIAISSK